MNNFAPLAERMRPKTLSEYVGQEHLIGPNGVISKTLEAGIVPSMILWGPPGVGKTTIANLIAQESKRPIYTLSAISSGVKDVRDVIAKAEESNMFQSAGALLFIDEIHRFSKSQQDSLLGAVERGTITLIGATTENPSFEVIGALLSRCQMYILKSLEIDQLKSLIYNSIDKDEAFKGVEFGTIEMHSMIQYSGGDARKLLNNFEIIAQAAIRKQRKENTKSSSKTKIEISDIFVKETLGSNIISHDKDGEDHYDLASVFIKTIRGSDPNAAVYWLARLIEAGEDVKFIARRLLILASEDIGLANPNALLIATSTFQAVQAIGYPESRIILSQCVVYLANSAKGNASYRAINEAQDFVRKTGKLAIPLHLKNAPTKLMKELGYGNEYQYPHEFGENFIEQEYMPDLAQGQNFFFPGSSKNEQEIDAKIKERWTTKYTKKQ